MVNSNDLTLLSVNQTAKMLSIRDENVKFLISTGRIKVIEIGKRIKIPLRELSRFIDEEPKVISNNNGSINNIINNRLGANKKLKQSSFSNDPKDMLDNILRGN